MKIHLVVEPTANRVVAACLNRLPESETSLTLAPERVTCRNCRRMRLFPIGLPQPEPPKNFEQEELF